MTKKEKEKNTKKEKEEIENAVENGVLVPKDVVEKENRQVVWFLVVVGLVFATVLIPYFWNEGLKTFDYANINWTIEEYAEPTGNIFHGRFLSFTNPNLYYNIYLREDPRINDIYTEGTFDSFKYGGYVSWNEEVESCRGELSRAMLDLSAFLKQGIGIDIVEGGASSIEFSESSGMDYATCDTKDRTIVIVNIGEESKVIQNKENPNCYTIYASSCEDLTSIEKFIVKSVDDWYS